MVAMYQKLSFSYFILFYNSKNRHLEFLNLSPQGLISSITKVAVTVVTYLFNYQTIERKTFESLKISSKYVFISVQINVVT